jgi:predicted dehydrogenase
VHGSGIVTGMSEDSGPAGTRQLRFGLVGTGYWAQVAHGAALASTPGIEFSAVWGRDPRAAGSVASSYGATAHTDFGAFLADVDAVAFSVPPDVQASLALTAAREGKHLLLEKPIATSVEMAESLAQAVEDAQVASVVFFTGRFQPAIRTWLADVADQDWAGGEAVWLGSALAPDNPFNTPWRREKGGLWDLGPHTISLLSPALGPVTSVTGEAGPLGASHLLVRHARGAVSTVTVTLQAPPQGDRLYLYVWGRPGRSVAPTLADDPVPALRAALSELAANITSGAVDHPCDVRFGLYVTRVLAQAQQQMARDREPLGSA